jgi:hypothetical protein
VGVEVEETEGEEAVKIDWMIVLATVGVIASLVGVSALFMVQP